jgi:hypothetical protein
VSLELSPDQSEVQDASSDGETSDMQYPALGQPPDKTSSDKLADTPTDRLSENPIEDAPASLMAQDKSNLGNATNGGDAAGGKQALEQAQNVPAENVPAENLVQGMSLKINHDSQLKSVSCNRAA